ncbi:MAG: acyl-CoA dehydrogenase family protein [Chloroflexi bacterium]|nr:acyl-CoA dehydrogenase family protein [Chloroflexota bacterium]
MRATLTERQELLRQTAREFALKELEPRAADVDSNEEFPRRQFDGLAAIGLLGLTMPEADGGAGGGYGELAVVIEELAAACGSTSTVFITHVSLGAATIARFGHAEQRARWVPALSRGDKIAAFALSEPGSGSDALALSTTASLDGDDYVINGSKVFITNGEVAGVFVVFVNSDRSKGHRGINAVVVERGAAGFTVSHMTGKMGMRGSATAELSFQDCRVPVANRLSDEGRGYSVALSILSSSRVSIAAQCVGLARGAYEAAVKYANQREAFGKHLADHQAIQFMLADMATEIDAARLLTHRAASLVDNGRPHVAESAMAKLFASEVANRAAHRAVQIHGGSGYFRPSKVERIYRDQRVTEIYEGTSEIQRLIIARSILEDRS